MRRQVPDDVHVALEQPEVEPRGVPVVDAAQVAPLHEPPQLVDGGVVDEGVPGHQHPAPAAGKGDQLDRLLHARRQRLLDQHVLVREQRLTGEGVVRVNRACDHHCLDLRGEQVPVVGEQADAGEAGTDVLEAILTEVGDAGDLDPQGLVQVSDQVGSPVAAADDPYVNRLPIALSLPVASRQDVLLTRHVSSLHLSHVFSCGPPPCVRSGMHARMAAVQAKWGPTVGVERGSVRSSQMLAPLEATLSTSGYATISTWNQASILIR